MMMWCEEGKPIERNAEYTFYAFPLLAAGCDRGLRFISRIFLRNLSLQQFFETTLWLQFLPIAMQFQYQAKQSLGETAMRRRIVKIQHKTASNCTAVACKRQERRKMIYWRKGTSGKKFVRTRFADDSTRQVFQSGSLCPIPEELENGLNKRKREKERELGSEEWRKRWLVRKWEGRGDRECTEEFFCIGSNHHRKH